MEQGQFHSGVQGELSGDLVPPREFADVPDFDRGYRVGRDMALAEGVLYGVLIGSAFWVAIGLTWSVLA